MTLPVSNVARLAGGLEKAKLRPMKGGPTLELMFNPESLSLQRSSNWKAQGSISKVQGSPWLTGAVGAGGSPPAAMVGGAMNAAGAAAGKLMGGGATAPAKVVAAHSRLTFQGSQPGRLTMVVHFNESFKLAGFGDVSKHIHQLESWMHLVKDGKDRHPPLLLFTWGKIGFAGYISSLNVTFMHFGLDGSPVHAKASITLQEEPAPDGSGNPTSGGPPGRRTHLVGAGDSLQSIAFREYDSATAWRRLAEANGIDDPLRLRLGAELIVPLPTEAPA